MITRQPKKTGFTLIEIAIVLIIVGLLIGGFFSFLQIYVKQLKNEELKSNIDVVRQGLDDFINKDLDPDPNDDIVDIRFRYPCPADPSAAADSPDFGTEQWNGATSCVETGNIKRVNASGRDVYIGSVPFRTIEISSNEALDPFGNRLVYAVTGDLAGNNDALSNNTTGGAITISFSSGSPITNAEFVVLSHGESGKGSFNAQGNPNAAICDITTSEGENCDWTISGNEDAVFSQLERSLADNTNFSDDTVAFTLSSGGRDELWERSTSNPNDIFNNNSNNIGIGTSTPTQKLDVNGSIRSSSSINTSLFCDVTGTTCFSLDFITNLHSNDCPTGEAMIGVNEDGTPQCALVTSPSTSYTTASCSSCSASCGGGTQSCTRSCVRDDTAATVDCSFCGGDCSFSQSCNTGSCAAPAPSTPPCVERTGRAFDELGPRCGGGGTVSCFVKGTKVTLADNTVKNIEDVQVGETLLGMDGVHNTVLALDRPQLAERDLYAINGSEFFVTPEHPFYTADGWKSIDPTAFINKHPELSKEMGLSYLQPGDIIVHLDGPVTVKTIESADFADDMVVYNFMLDGNQTYYADGYLVHNEAGPGAGAGK